MNELAVQGANDTNENIDREAINEELSALTTELDRISETTQFNKQNLLDGSFKSKNLQVGANANQKITISIQNMNAETLGLRGITGAETTYPQTGKNIDSITYKGMTYQWDSSTSAAANLSMAKVEFSTAIGNKASVDKQYVQQVSGTSVFYLDQAGSVHSTASAAMATDISAAVLDMKSSVSGNLEDYLDMTDLTADEAGVAASYQQFTFDKPSVDTYAVANATITAVQNAINKVSSQRSALGALQNRLEHTIANLDNVAENTQAAESRIRDTDMAAEMVEYSKNNILAQAGQSMLAQANQGTQGVLSLLQ